MFNLSKIILTFFFLLFTYIINAQIPAKYYYKAKDLSGSELKTALYNIIKNHKEFPYTSKEIDVWDILKESDKDPSNPENVILFYSRKSVNAEQEYNDREGWSREHVWSKSRGQFGKKPGAGTDAHHIRPADIRVNSSKNNRWFAECDKNASATGLYLCPDKWIAEPKNEVKGDVARMLFYMAVRYEGVNNEPDLELINYIPDNKESKLPLYAKLSDLLTWHKQDPVDNNEKYRNDIIFKYQHNRNPFIDHPEFAALIWNKNGIINSNDILQDYLIFYILGKKVMIPKNINSFENEKKAYRTGMHILKDFFENK